MALLLLDENLPRAFLKALKRERPDLDVTRIQDVGLLSASDPEILAYASKNRRVVVTRDKATMKDHAAELIRAGKPMSGLIVVRPRAPFRSLIEDLLLISEATNSEEWQARVIYIPL